ncbi:hypothetical protein HMI54_013468, partial [Coelomomyces lativittatus]
MSFASAYSTYYTQQSRNSTMNSNVSNTGHTFNPTPTSFDRSASPQSIHSTNTSTTSGTQKPKSEANKLGAFLSDCLFVGCLKGFKYFEVYLRGREELLVRVYNQPSTHVPVISKQPSSKDLAKS